MKRSIALLALAGAVVLLAGCGSSSAGTAAPASTSAASSADTSSSSSSSASDTASSTSSSDDSSSSGSASSSEESTTTIGNSTGGLDDQSTKWFDTFCTGVAPIADLTSLGSDSTTDKASQAKFVDLFTKAGAAFSSTAVTLKDVPPPTFAGGPEFAAKAVPALGILGSAFTDAAKKLAVVDVTKDPTGFATALSGLSSSMTQVSGLSNLDFTPATKAAIATIPSCKKIPGIGS